MKNLQIFEISNTQLEYLFKYFAAIHLKFNHKIENTTYKYILKLCKQAGTKPNKLGLCSLLNRYFRAKNLPTHTVIKLRRELFRSWVYHSGNESFPVPSTDPKLCSQQAYTFNFKRGSMYQYRYGALRRNLIAHCYQLVWLEMNRRELTQMFAANLAPQPFYSITLYMPSTDHKRGVVITALWQLHCQVDRKVASYIPVVNKPRAMTTFLHQAMPICSSLRYLAQLNSGISLGDRPLEMGFMQTAKWSNYSGNLTYPVPAPVEAKTGPEYMYHTTNQRDYYAGVYGQNRKDLLKYLVKTSLEYFNSTAKIKTRPFPLELGR